MDPAEFANFMTKDICDYWVSTYNSYSDPAPVLSTINLARLDGVAAALEAFSNRLVSVGKNYPEKLTEVNAAVQLFDAGNSDRRVDLYNYADLVKTKINDSQLDSYADNLKTAISQAVTENQHTPANPEAHGISIYQPGKTYFMRYAAGSYATLQLSAVTHWNEWLANQP